MEQLIQHRAQHLGDDLLSALIFAAGEDGIDHMELDSNCIFLFSAGYQTTRDLIGNGVLAMLREPYEYAALAGDPGALALAEESLRFDAPVAQSWEVALTNTEIGGHLIAESVQVFSLLGACNHDPTRFDEPERFRIDRPDNVPMAFSWGPRNCFGSAVARRKVLMILEARHTLPEPACWLPAIPTRSSGERDGSCSAGRRPSTSSTAEASAKHFVEH